MIKTTKAANSNGTFLNVPLMPTKEMIQAFYDLQAAYETDDPPVGNQAVLKYQAMLRASPEGQKILSPPATNRFVAEGCEKFRNPAPTDVQR